MVATSVVLSSLARLFRLFSPTLILVSATGYYPNPGEAFYCGENMDCYAILSTTKTEVDELALQAATEINKESHVLRKFLRRKFRAASLQAHPDTAAATSRGASSNKERTSTSRHETSEQEGTGQHEEQHKNFHVLKSAFQVLTTPKVRMAYDYFQANPDDEQVFLEAYYVDRSFAREHARFYQYKTSTSTGADIEDDTDDAEGDFSSAFYSHPDATWDQRVALWVFAHLQQSWLAKLSETQFACLGFCLLLVLISAVQYIHRVGRYQRAIRQVVGSQAFQARVYNEMKRSKDYNAGSNANDLALAGSSSLNQESTRDHGSRENVVAPAAVAKKRNNNRKAANDRIRDKEVKQKRLEDAAMEVFTNQVEMEEEMPNCADLFLCWCLALPWKFCLKGILHKKTFDKAITPGMFEESNLSGVTTSDLYPVPSKEPAASVACWS
ncbi:unnamed protein product, partial [Amoebophrya sp. A120]|eukprot:GSA120T00012131001.1